MRTKSLAVIAVPVLLLVIGLPSSSADLPLKAPGAHELERQLPPGTGFIPPPVDLSHLKGEKIPEGLKGVMLPIRWDWREQGKVTSVKDQGSCGSCYAFAAVANVESKLLVDGEATLDLSENNAKECNWYGTSCDGGSYLKMANWFSKKGTVLESCDSYVPRDTTCKSSCAYQKSLLDWRIISGSSVPTPSTLQSYIHTYGPVYTSLYAGDINDVTWWTEFSDYDGSYTLYYTGSWTPNHAVLIVGWDDTLSHAGGSGAWIVKNSWGISWGGICGYGSEAGYFTIAYGSASIGMYSSYMHGWQSYDQNGEVLYYDEGGWTGSWGYGDVLAWGLCKFVPTSTSYVPRVEFWTTDETTDIDVYLYDSFDGSVAFNTSPLVSSGNDVYAVVIFTNSSYGYPVAADDQGASETGVGYISEDGTSWIDLGATYGEDIAIRVRTTLYSGAESESHAGSPESFTLMQNYPNPFNLGTTIEYDLPKISDVTIRIYDLRGREVELIVYNHQRAGHHETRWSPAEIPSGIYFYKLTAGDFSQAMRMTLVK
jgi:C1A family cysteine protease